VVKRHSIGFGKCLSCVLCALIGFPSVGYGFEVNKCTNKLMYALFEDKFTEPIEVIYFLMNDLRLYGVTSNFENKVGFDLYNTQKIWKKDGYIVSDIIVVIHGHKKSRYFSPSDIRRWRSLKRAGFTGDFCIYLKRNKTIYIITEDGNDN